MICHSGALRRQSFRGEQDHPEVPIKRTLQPTLPEDLAHVRFTSPQNRKRITGPVPCIASSRRLEWLASSLQKVNPSLSIQFSTSTRRSCSESCSGRRLDSSLRGFPMSRGIVALSVGRDRVSASSPSPQSPGARGLVSNRQIWKIYRRRA
jgi:hypothetical protein